MIEINNLTTGAIDRKFLEKVVQTVLKGEKIKREIDLSIAFIGHERMRTINKRYRGEDRATDVLSFSEPRALLKKFKAGQIQRRQALGEIIVCSREIKKNAKRFDSTFKKELSLSLIHGVLHLLGYEHEKGGKKAKKMEEKQNYYLSLL